MLAGAGAGRGDWPALRPIGAAHSFARRPAGGWRNGRPKRIARLLPSFTEFFFVLFFAFFFLSVVVLFVVNFFSFLFFFLLIFFRYARPSFTQFRPFCGAVLFEKKTNLLPIVDPGKATFTFTGFLLGFTGFCKGLPGFYRV